MLPESVHAELAQLLDALQSADNSVRAQAEEHLATNWTATRPDVLLMGLVEQIRGSNDPTVRIVNLYVRKSDMHDRLDLSLLLSSDASLLNNAKRLTTKVSRHS